MMDSGSIIIGPRCFIFGVKLAEVNAPAAVVANLRLPFSRVFGKANTLKSTRKLLPRASIMLILKSISFAQVAKTVVLNVAINMINHEHRPLAMAHGPNHTVGPNVLLKNYTFKVPILVGKCHRWLSRQTFVECSVSRFFGVRPTWIGLPEAPSQLSGIWVAGQNLAKKVNINYNRIWHVASPSLVRVGRCFERRPTNLTVATWGWQ